ncbi:MAG: N-6 DNA methylase, partial [Planctomycetes bacterium]|nr:N-6 DNA methylase [Planctomycetota bacterium]
MSQGTQLKPAHKAVKAYYASLAAYAGQSVAHEGAVRSAFQNLLADTGRKFGWMLIPELTIDANGHQIRPDGTFRDEFTIERGYWEAKDTDDDLDTEIKKKIKLGYRLTNTIFEDTREARLYQDGKLAFVADLTKPQPLCDLLNTFFAHTEPAHEDFGKAVGEFKQRVPDLARGLVDLIKRAHDDNPRFAAAFGKFYDLCRQSLNPNLSPAAVDEMLVQHLLTERLIRTVFDSQDFTRRNVIAAEIEQVIDALVSQSFNRHDYLQRLDRFYVAIEQAARTITGFAEKQHFLNVVYERFFQGYSVKVADTHGIVYTPQEIVDFMCASVAEVLEQEFGRKLGDPGVNILDPCTGTGNFIVNLIRRIPKRDLPRMYREQLFANEVMLLPYYIAALNIEHAYYERTGQYEPFEGLCFVDTLDLAEGPQRTFGFMTEENVQRVERQRQAPITVIIGNPPYNVGQLSYNDQNQNRKYPVIDKRISETYGRDSRATSVSKLADPYVKFFRWATDRLEGRDGVVAFVSNNGFVDQVAFDGMRKHLLQDFTCLYHLDLQGNVRHNPRLSGTMYNVFGIQVGVGITVAVRRKTSRRRGVRYIAVDKAIRRERKLAWLSDLTSLTKPKWRSLRPDERHTWLQPKHADEFASFLLMASKETRASSNVNVECVFQDYSLGVATHRDAVVYDFDKEQLATRVSEFVEHYNTQVDRLKRKPEGIEAEDFIDRGTIVWDRDLKKDLLRGRRVELMTERIRNAQYRPYSRRWLYFDRILNAEVYGNPRIWPLDASNACVATSTVAYRAQSFSALAIQCVADLHVCATLDGHECFPFYVYDEDGTNRRENVTDWALGHFRGHYGDERIGKWDIFYYVYGVLHHPGYRAKFADNLKRELPRIPLAPPLPPDQNPERERRANDAGPGADASGSDAGPDADASGSDVGPDHKRSPKRKGGISASRCGNPRSRFGLGSEEPAHGPGAGASGSDVGPGADASGSVRNGAASGFWAFADAGRRLAELHIGYESLEPWPLKWLETPGEPLSYHVEKMRLSKDKKSLMVNDSLTLGGIPPEVFDYRLGNRSALE